MDWTITLHEYRLRYPESAAIPTLTQSGLLGLLLDRQELKRARLARRRAVWKRVCSAPGDACAGIWRALVATDFRQAADHVEVAARRQA